MENSEILKKVIRSFLLVVSRKTSQDFTIKSMNYILEKHKSQYRFLETISVNINPSDNLVSVEVENTLVLQYSNIAKISDFLEIVCTEIFREIIGNEYYYNTDLHELVLDIVEGIGGLLEELGIKIRWNTVIQGATTELKGANVKFSAKKYKNNSQVLKPLFNSLVDLVYDGLLKKEKKRIDAVSIIVSTIRELEKKHTVFKFMLLEDIDKEKMDYGLKTQWRIEDVFFFDSDDQYAVKAVSKIDEIDNEVYTKALTEFILIIGSYINVQDRPLYVERLRGLMDEDCLEKFLEIGIDLDEIEEIFRNQGYNDVIKKTFEALIAIIGSKTSNSFAFIALDTIFKKISESGENEILRYVTIDKSLIDKGVDAIIIDAGINKEEPYKIAKALKLVLKMTQDNQQNHAEKASFINDLKREMGERYFAEIEKMGVNINIIGMRYV